MEQQPNKEKIYEKWLPILEKLGITGDKAKSLAEYADYHEKTFHSTLTTTQEIFANFQTPFIHNIARYGFYGETVKNNRLIADFMKQKDTVKYHESWDLLMPVVIEIEKGNYGVKMCRKVVEIYYDDTKEIIIKEKKENRIASLYEALVKFIKWKNENNK